MSNTDVGADKVAHHRWRAALKCGALFLIVLVFIAVSGSSAMSSPRADAQMSIEFARAIPPARTHSPIARRDQAAPVATITPTPPPIPPAVRPEVDPFTIALYRFDTLGDSHARDETGYFPGTFVGNAAVTGLGWFDGALQTDRSNSYVRTGHLGYLEQGTLEMFVDFSTACWNVNDNFALASAVNETSGQTVLYLGAHTALLFGIVGNGGWRWADSGINPCRYLTGAFPPAGPVWPYDKWRFHHIAATWGPRGIEIWVDGVLHGVNTTDSLANVPPYQYKCSPQMQIESAVYPKCPAPAIAPPLAPGAYTGGLVPYTSFRFGCDSTGLCFSGKLDEVRVSNLQRTFEPMNDPQAVPNPTPTPTGFFPDLVVANLQVPVVAFDTGLKTIVVNVTNQGNQNYNAPIVAAPARVGQGNGQPRGNPLRASASYTGTQNYFFYVDLYVDRARPSGVSDLGNCPTQNGGTNWAWVYSLAVGQTVAVPIDCWLGPGAHTFYAQLDTCDDPTGAMCSSTYGYNLERNESNNRYPGVTPIKGRDPFTFIPYIFRR
ncbi:MAG: hypothetical protein HZC40_09085 [Chloroflexi bacterium]|nr:hypothetical protein [Chloroflexota bacterium]